MQLTKKQEKVWEDFKARFMLEKVDKLRRSEDYEILEEHEEDGNDIVDKVRHINSGVEFTIE